MRLGHAPKRHFVINLGGIIRHSSWRAVVTKLPESAPALRPYFLQPGLSRRLPSAPRARRTCRLQAPPQTSPAPFPSSSGPGTRPPGTRRRNNSQPVCGIPGFNSRRVARKRREQPQHTHCVRRFTLRTPDEASPGTSAGVLLRAQRVRRTVHRGGSTPAPPFSQPEKRPL